jgi:hypothetical protein
MIWHRRSRLDKRRLGAPLAATLTVTTRAQGAGSGLIANSTAVQHAHGGDFYQKAFELTGQDAWAGGRHSPGQMLESVHIVGV